MWRHRHTAHDVRSFNSNTFATSAALAEVCALLSSGYYYFFKPRVYAQGLITV